MNYLRDTRERSFLMNDEYLNGYAKLCGIHATGVYMSLCRHASKEQTCFPSKRLIAEELGISQRSVFDALKVLENWNIIVISGQGKKTDGKFKSNIYTLIDKSQWIPKPKKDQFREQEVPTAQYADGTECTHPWARGARIRGHVVPNKDTHSKETHLKETSTNVEEAKPTYGNEDINWLIDQFEKEMNFKSAGTKDRWMAKHLLNNFSKDQLTAMMRFCATQEYAPRIGSIEKLWFKRGDILAGISKEISSSNKSFIKI